MDKNTKHKKQGSDSLSDALFNSSLSDKMIVAFIAIAFGIAAFYTNQPAFNVLSHALNFAAVIVGIITFAITKRCCQSSSNATGMAIMAALCAWLIIPYLNSQFASQAHCTEQTVLSVNKKSFSPPLFSKSRVYNVNVSYPAGRSVSLRIHTNEKYAYQTGQSVQVCTYKGFLGVPYLTLNK